MFDKSSSLFPSKEAHCFLAHCSISPLYAPAAQRATQVLSAQSRHGIVGIKQLPDILGDLHRGMAHLLQTGSENISFVKNTSEGMGMIANGYPFAPGDEIISYIHEYPSNHYPWRLQQERGVTLHCLPDRDLGQGQAGSLPCAWSMQDLEALISPKTRMIALSHVQFSSGFAADLQALGELCEHKGIDLVVDAAQSLGCLQLYPETMHISAVVASGWKWLLGPVGTGVMYTSPAFRHKLGHVLTGAELMVQDSDYLNHTWDPHTDGRRFEYSTSHLALAAALATCTQDISGRYGIQAIEQETFRLQDMLRSGLDPDLYTCLDLPDTNRSGILSVMCRKKTPEEVQDTLMDNGVVTSARSGYLRIAPFFCTTEEEIGKAVDLMNKLG